MDRILLRLSLFVLATVFALPASGQNLYVGSNSANQTTNFTSGSYSYSYTYIGYNANDNSNTLGIINSNTFFQTSEDLDVGDQGTDNSLIISNGGTAYIGYAFVGVYQGASNNSVIITGKGSVLNSAELLEIGSQGSGNSLVITNGGYVDLYSNTSSQFVLGVESSNNSALITGEGSKLGTAFLGLGNGSGNSLVISNGAIVTSQIAQIGLVEAVYGLTNASSNNSVLVTGTGSLWTNSGSIYVGYGGGSGGIGSGNLTLGNGGTVASQSIVIASQSNSAGTLNIGSPSGMDTNLALAAPAINFGIGTGTINFNQADTSTITSAISGYGTLNQLGIGKTILTASNSFSGPTYVNSGTLLIASSGTLSGGGSLMVSSGGTLQNNGMVAGTALLSGTLAGNGGSFGGLQFNGGSSLIWNIDDFNGVAGTNWDVLNALALDLSNLSSTNPLTIYVEGISGAAATNASSTYVFNFLDVSNSVTGFDPSRFTVNTSLFTVDPSLAGGVWSVGTNSFGNGTELTLTYAVPEPSIYALLGMGLGILTLGIALRHRRA